MGVLVGVPDEVDELEGVAEALEVVVALMVLVGVFEGVELGVVD